MAQVTIKINGYAHTVGCEDGQEGHLLAMARAVESRIDSIKALGGQGSGEARLLVLASLLMADEIHDLRVQLETVRGAEGAPRPLEAEKTRRRRLAKIADRAEAIAEQMERPAPDGEQGHAPETDETLANR